MRRRAVLEGLEDAAEAGPAAARASGPCSENERESSSRVWKRTDPPPSSQPLSARSYWSARARPAGSSERSATRRSPEVVARSRLVLGHDAAERVVGGVPALRSPRPTGTSGSGGPRRSERTSGSTRPSRPRRARTRSVPSASWAWMSASATMRTRSPGPPPAASTSARGPLLADDLDDGAADARPASSSASQTRPCAPARRATSVSSSMLRAAHARHARRGEADDAAARRERLLEHAEPRAGGRGSRGRAAPCRSAGPACPSRIGRSPRAT